MRRLGPATLLAIVLSAAVGAGQNPTPLPEFASSAFESYVELLRQQAGIPGISGALVQDGVIVWERGLGMANLEARIRATPDTPYPLADLSQIFAAVLLLECVELGRLELDAPVSNYGVSLAEPMTLRQVLSHTSSLAQGGVFKYDAGRYASLTTVMEQCVRQPYRRSIVHRLLDRIAMIDSVPGRDLQNTTAVPEGLLEPEALARYGRILERLAVPYRVDARRRATRTELPIEGINAATGLVSTVRDLARFDAALETELLLRHETKAAAWSPTLGPGGVAQPMGLGWFIQTYRGTQIIWHFGVIPNAYSALLVKVPSRRVTMILLANSDGLVVPSQIEAADLTRSLFATVFLRMLL